jgi:Holliday junction resolvase RusA-like endonuclease
MRFSISTAPIALPRPRVTRGGRVYYPKIWKDYHKTAVQELRIRYPREIIAQPCHIHITYTLPAPKYRPAAPLHRALYDQLKEPTTHRYPYPCKPDIDNMIKGTLDILQAAGILKDDNMVTMVSGQKYATKDAARIGTDIVVDLI